MAWAEPGTDRDVVVLDGGMSNVLEDRGQDLSGGLWTARLLAERPEEIAAVHREYFAAGARVATTASYQASVPGFVDRGVDRAEAERLVALSVALARQVRDELAGDGVRRYVAGSVGPYGAYLADGSEYTGRYGVSSARLREFHEARLELLAGAGPDLLAVETIPDLDEAVVLADLLDGAGLPAWFSFSVHAGRTRAGQPLDEAFAVAASVPEVVAVGVNCCRPEEVLPAVEAAVGRTGLPAVAYPNSGEDWVGGRWVGEGRFAPTAAVAWVEAGARLVGGCCRVGPDQIRAIADAVATRVEGPGGLGEAR